MLTRRAPTNILVCTIALWVIAGFLPGQPAQAAAAGPAYSQQDSGPGGGSSQGREAGGTTSINGDPDAYAHVGLGNPAPGDGTTQHRSFINILLQLFSIWWSLVWGPPL